MIILGLTGSIGMGKSTAAAYFRYLRVPVFDADAAVHALYASDRKAQQAIGKLFPEALVNGAIDRNILGREVFGDAAALKKLEAILHPRVQRKERDFLCSCIRRRRPLAVLDIPLLYETRGEQRCDAVAVVSAPLFIQQIRVLGRPGMSRVKFEQILARQTPDREKRRRADFIIPSGHGKREALRAILSIRQDLLRKCGKSWPGKFLRDN